MRILGPLEVVSGGSSLTLGGQKQRAVLAILATRANTVVSADELIEWLWGESPPATATTTVQVYVSRLRKLIGADLIVTTGGGYALRVEPDQLDAARFDRLATRGRELRIAGQPSEAATALGEALSLWRGPALSDFAYDSWAQSGITRLEEERLACLEERLEADLACGRDSELVGELEALVAAHPLRERLRGQFMLSLYRAGRQAEALEAYQRTRATLVDELGIEPSPELQELNRKILTQDVSSAAPPSELPLPTGTVTLLATDIEGSTRLLQLLGERYREVLAEHRRVLSEAFGSNGGHEVDSQGDSILVAFPRANDAVLAAAEAQRGLASAEWRDGADVAVRVGLHTGEPSLSDGRYVGLDVHRVARICAAAHGRQVVLSRETHELLGTLPNGVGIRDLGQHWLKDLDQPERLYQLELEGLVNDFPPLRALYPTNLPRPATAFVGRRRELEALEPLLRSSDVRLLTLTGPGGSGKSRLALELGQRLLRDFPDGVYLVALAPVSDPELVVPTIAQALEIGEAPPEPLRQTLARALADQRLLLLVDNFEHVIDAAPDLSDLIEHAPELTVLATSRGPLRLSPEHRYELPPLELPDPDDDLETIAETDAVAFFLDRAGAAQAGFNLNEEVAGPVVEICRRLDGLPLALELAAARLTVLSPQALVSRLDDRLRLLIRGSRDRPSRQQTLLATIEWSYDLLDDDEKTLFARLAVFAGSFDLEAAEAVCDADLDTLAALIDQSLLRQAVEDRFFMLETIREYALVRLAKSETTIRNRHAAHYLALAEQGMTQLKGSEPAIWIGRLELEHPNLRAALDWAGESGQLTLELQLCAALGSFWHTRSLLAEGMRRLERALDGAPAAPAELRAEALDWAAMLAHGAGKYVRERELAEEQLALCEELDDVRVRARALSNLGLAALGEEDLDKGMSLLERSLDHARSAGDPWTAMVSALNLGVVAFARGELERARSLLEDALAQSREIGERIVGSLILFDLAHVHLETGDHVSASRCLADGFRSSVERATNEGVDYGLVILAAVAARAGNAEQAARLLGAAGARMEAGGVVLEPTEQALHDSTVTAVRTQLAEGVLRTTWEQGRTFSLEQAVDYALSID